MNTQMIKTASFVAVAFATLMCATGAHAQISFTGRFTLPYEVHWSNAVLPAGEYSIVIPSLNSPGIVRSAGWRQVWFVPAGHAEDSKVTSAYLTLAQRGGVL